jgi:hypothetical protein
MKTPEEIAAIADQHRGNFRMIRALFLEQDESNLFTVCGQYNATQRAINRVQQSIREGFVVESNLDYALAIDGELTIIIDQL